MLRVTSFLRSGAVAAILAACVSAGAGQAVAAGPQQPPASHPQTAPLPSAVPLPNCTKPGVPLCMDDGTTFVSADKMSGCQFEVKEYVDKTMAYLKCLNDENIATGQDLTRNVERFNCRLSGRKGCN
ncbi:hypothetical protein [Azospirillum doebereinerae]|uniref:Uncharacterized protein n=1 Tax=Azospirillum doebereinerae TaxID=92933 RepID=A0A3S1CJH0_9PROT|nr:hypothetical protein [Azospirillum doebereinerae]MCG5239155.1 hypothetical protein [Azospirillum doebereinerae]RUQ75652.1 hypothetical protein EJ913_00590 [Azospirillum doebereinerae]